MNAEVEKMKRTVASLKQKIAEDPDAADPSLRNLGKKADSGSDQAGDEQQAGAQDADEQQADEGGQEGGQPEVKLSARDQQELEKALKSGWKPPEDFDGDPEDFIKPREWNRTVALYKRIDRGRDEVRRLQDQINTFDQRIKNVMEVTKAKTIAELEAERDQAIEDSDHKEVRRIDKEIKQAETDLAYEEPKVAAPEIRPEVESWMEENPWFETDKDMTNFAVDFQMAQLQRCADPSNPTSRELEAALNRTTRAVKNEFPEHFQRKPRATAQTLENPNRKPAKRKFTYNDLTTEEKTVLAHIERLPGGMSREDYIKACADMRQAK